jgi:murein DD-endopeptidase MepM/ murein hydrolase activator NlpD
MLSLKRYSCLAADETFKPACKASFVRVSAFILAFVFMVLSGTNVLYAEEAVSSAQEIASATPAGNTDGVLTTTEQMIENLILQIDQENERREKPAFAKLSGKMLLSALPAIKPIAGYISSGFGMRFHPIFNRAIFHEGTDFSAPVGTKVMATGDGTVVSSGFETGYGKKVIIDHGSGYKTVYAHLSKAVVRQGQHVRRGDIIAFSGNTGLSTGPHLHYEVRKNNIQVNPTAYFSDDKVPAPHTTMQQKDNSNS